MTQEEACAVLGITDEDDEKAIDNKYKKLMREYHPDANEGRPEAAQMARGVVVFIEILSFVGVSWTDGRK